MNKRKLANGIKFLAAALPIIFIAPGFLMDGFVKSDKGEHGLLIFALTLCITAVFLAVMGIRNLLAGFFEKPEE